MLEPTEPVGYHPGMTSPVTPGTSAPAYAHLAACEAQHRDGGGLHEPFRTRAERDDWVARHVDRLGCRVTASTIAEGEGGEGLPAYQLERARPARSDRAPGYRWRLAFAGGGWGEWVGPYETPQLALADLRGTTEALAR